MKQVDPFLDCLMIQHAHGQVLVGSTHDRLVPCNCGLYFRDHPTSVVASHVGKGITQTRQRASLWRGPGG
jgi:hypothetical protein